MWNAPRQYFSYSFIHHTLFKLQKEFFGCQSTPVACQRTVASYNPVAWGETDREFAPLALATARTAADIPIFPGHIPVGYGRAIGNRQQFIPYPFLELGTDKQQRHVKRAPLTGK